MPDSKTSTDNRDRFRVAGGQDYEVAYLAEQAEISTEQARDLIKRLGNDRQTLMQAAKALSDREP